ncbi:LGFP repeat-containing protein [Corynebacterium striatum]|uniref:LGFP repeat-containing protein n=1 Tax=Corynebacterium striatum TaxID=43770 RepID=UPI003F808041
MKIRRLILATCAALSSLSLVATSSATADEFHGHWVKGRILETYNRLGGYGTFGNASTEELNAANGGKFQEFQRDSSIYWHPSVSNGTAHQVGGKIREKWGAYNWENGYLNYPITNELPTRAANGRFNHFQGGSIYWSPATGAHTIQGAIRDRWANQDWEVGSLGFPTTDEQSTPSKTGKYNHFQGGSIYWSPATGAHTTQGRIRDYWANIGWENSRFGFPTSEEYRVGGGAIQQDFQGQNLQWVPSNSSALAPYKPDYASYDQQYLLFDQNERWTPQAINREVVTHFNQYFTFTGCPDELYAEAKCELDAVGGTKAPVKIEAISADGFSIRSLEGHPEGADRLINFKLTTYSYNGATNIRLRVQASGPVSNASYLGPLNSETVARYSWSKFSQNLQKRINNSLTTYITSDKFTPSIRSFRSISPEDTTILSNDPGMEETEVINPTNVDTSKITNEVPLFPIDTEDAKLEQTLGETNPATTTETSDLATETLAGDETKSDVTVSEPAKSSTQEPINPS